MVMLALLWTLPIELMSRFSGLFMGHDPAQWSSLGVFKTSRVGSGRVGSGRVGSGPVGSGRVNRF